MECGTLGMFLLACVLLCVMERASTAPAAHRRAAAVAGNSVAAAGAAVALERRTGGEHWFSRGDGENLVKRSAERRLIRKRGKGRRRQKQVMIKLEPAQPEEGHERVSYNHEGVIEGAWVKKFRLGRISFDNFRQQVDVMLPGIYNVRAQLFFSDLKSWLPMGFCIEVVKDDEVKDRKCTVHQAGPNGKNSGTSSVEDDFELEEGMHIRVRMDMSNNAGEDLIFEPKTSAFTVRRVVQP